MHSAPYVWTEQYQAAVLELDAEKLFAQIARTQVLLQMRRAELLCELPSNNEELGAITRALQVLSQLQEIEQKKMAVPPVAKVA